jgi:transcriptional regulator with XRE-family HTH domain
VSNKKSQIELTDIIASNLPRIRSEYGISQTRLGELLGKSRQQISKFERKVAPLSWDTCLAIVLLACKHDKTIFESIVGKDFMKNMSEYINDFR